MPPRIGRGGPPRKEDMIKSLGPSMRSSATPPVQPPAGQPKAKRTAGRRRVARASAAVGAAEAAGLVAAAGAAAAASTAEGAATAEQSRGPRTSRLPHPSRQPKPSSQPQPSRLPRPAAADVVWEGLPDADEQYRLLFERNPLPMWV